MKSSMDHESAILGGNDGNDSLGDAILPFGTNATVANRLQVTHGFVDEAFALEDAVVSAVGADVKAHLK